ncbi:uncharacterized protein MONOS_4734 [Monocercomonoides exilis]|uniref:uncharacterized protein n=1 Tax=Monocercomonoides exilis TaxID=2049356 RepID=UPI003559EF2E|nr:hypothetical protein MONOS_4734 [Monocercomonoides exilis]|eukprot:MONOS_4734.1-p1 / transcript=MONOS_4734.1 / gene=MONOS_4734 / organism=Monocercomonoides_exilis_PA203 / gene_product=unspecified product / transcript_product=unspecified product / location=Mono_scaffold00130:17218-19470(+) / protein_length=544 / sequence_SO=supercontig / SO=protein_coding / is_pseudo=false
MFGQPKPKLSKACMIVFSILICIVGAVGVFLVVAPSILMGQTKQFNFFFFVLLLVGVLLVVFMILGFFSVCTNVDCFGKLYFFGSLAVTLALFIISTIIMADGSIVDAVIAASKQEVGCNIDIKQNKSLCSLLDSLEGLSIAAGVIGLIAGILFLITLFIVSRRLGLRGVVQTSLFFGSFCLFVLALLIFLYSVIIMASSFGTGVAILIVVCIMGVLLAVAGVWGICGSIKFNKKKTQMINGTMFSVFGVVLLIVGVVGFVMNTRSAEAVTDSSSSRVCKLTVVRDKETREIKQLNFNPFNMTTKQAKKCCSYLGVDLTKPTPLEGNEPQDSPADDIEVGICLPLATPQEVYDMYVKTASGLIFPGQTIMFYTSLLVIWLGICSFITMTKGEDWYVEDLQQKLMQKGLTLTEEELKKLGKTRKELMAYAPTRGGGSQYVVNQLSVVDPELANPQQTTIVAHEKSSEETSSSTDSSTNEANQTEKSESSANSSASTEGSAETEAKVEEKAEGKTSDTSSTSSSTSAESEEEVNPALNGIAAMTYF